MFVYAITNNSEYRIIYRKNTKQSDLLFLMNYKTIKESLTCSK